MGYACPVCETPERDGEHLANHLAFTAMLHGGAHEQWLDEHAPDWSDEGAAELAPVAVEHADEVPHETVFEESVPSETGHDHASPPADGDALDAATLDGDAGQILAEAREMTQAMLDDDDNKS